MEKSLDRGRQILLIIVASSNSRAKAARKNSFPERGWKKLPKIISPFQRASMMIKTSLNPFAMMVRGMEDATIMIFSPIESIIMYAMTKERADNAINECMELQLLSTCTVKGAR